MEILLLRGPSASCQAKQISASESYGFNVKLNYTDELLRIVPSDGSKLGRKLGCIPQENWTEERKDIL